MAEQNEQADWYYVGHFGQLGPLTLTQMQELAMDGVILADTYVWKTGMSDWTVAEKVADLKPSLGISAIADGPPAMPRAAFATPPALSQSTYAAGSSIAPTQQADWRYIQAHAPKSDKRRAVAGLLNIFIPGIGRFYLGYMAHGVLQLFLVPFCGVGWIWSVCDGIYILAGGVKFDGYGRRLED